jgi:hypothetical protein
MAKEHEDIPGVIPENEFQPELEKDVEYYYSIAEKPTFISKKRYTPNKYPDKFKDTREETDYQLSEIQKLIHGADGLCGKGYGWLHYAKLRDPERGKISPEFRVKQEEYFRKVEALQTTEKGKGIVGFKRRRWGFSWAGAWDDMHDCVTKPYYQIGMNSKSENDSRLLFRNVKFIYQNLPEWLRPRSTASDRRDFMEFAWYEKDVQGNRIKKGLQSWISSVAPTNNAHEGQAYSKLRIDEAGKIENLMTLYGFAVDCLRLGAKKIGPEIILGTVGDITKDGRGLMELYQNHTAYDLDRFHVFGYHGLIVDEFGNDLIMEAIRWVIYERHKLKSATKKFRDAFYQKYPLCERDAFNQVSEGGVGNIQLINDQVIKLLSNPFESRTGWMRPKPDGGVDFVPNSEGKIIVYDMPDIKRVNGYVAGSDPAEHDNLKKKAGKDISDLALAIIAKPVGLEAPKLVLEYVDRPERLDSFFEQSAMALKWYNNTKVLIEDNRARMLNYFKTNYPDLLPLVPASIATAKGGYEMKNSVKMTEERKQQMMGLIEDNVDKYSKFIPSIKLLEQFKVFGDLHADDDLAIAYGWALVMLQADKRAVQFQDQIANNLPKAKLERHGNTLRLVTPQGVINPRSGPVFNPRNIPRTPFSR